MDQGLIDDLVRGVGYRVLKLATAGTYRSGDSGLFLEGCSGLLIVAMLFYFLFGLVT